ncbi:MAG: bifunctional phosphoribosylaminoimidazolecarboxamide formyltransferase/IMP cyclohydrolase [Candidatus Omnitrophica bacterium]|nr:bifunctional phosphoribosylaminoimidazolecarboxamide formyltransferase/IMP cyclohydrolase [Candidatus Omnitrophota bacterium]MBU4473242.1 bifunctional phosphoribosylaminoimidazolecarboxamide formyltransferase/IMP cyclohydrolase [Candidatus Omnitrophota bacterium]MCG2706531.1 bifunctional phosphoribosylaminoimidazolecarboxamide formyltransferase/IMP cyclohydrolase [Candidatus Omnitrophota bacterium]
MVKIKRALISVSDKTGILEFAKELNKLGVEMISTGGTAKLLRENNIPVKEVSEYTGFPEMLNGRVKTLHPKIHAGLLAIRSNQEHMATLKEQGIALIDMVVINLYPFQETIRKSTVTIEEVIENIDIGGPSMLRSAAKNAQSVAAVCNPARYLKIIEELKNNRGCLSETLMRQLGIEVFGVTSHYDSVIYNYLKNYFIDQGQSTTIFPQELDLSFAKLQDLRYGENPHQKACFYKEKQALGGLTNMKQLQGKELSFNNILDLNSAVELVKEFKHPTAIVVKHNNPCGAAEDRLLVKAYLAAWQCDKLSAFGSIVALNRKLDSKTAKAILKSGFLECIIAPAIDAEAKDLFKDKKNLRLLELRDLELVNEFDFKRISSGLLAQEKDLKTLDEDDLKVVTKKKPTKKQLESLIFGWKVAKHVKSNAIVLTRGTKTVGIGAGQMSRVDSVIIARRKAAKQNQNCCLASDAFFPKADAVIEAIKAGVVAVIQPGGSISDEEIIKVCNKYKISMVFTGIRHFRH